MCIYYLRKSRHRLGCRPHSLQTSLRPASSSRLESRCELQAWPRRCRAVWGPGQNNICLANLRPAYLPFLSHSESDNRRAIASKEIASTFHDRATPWVSFLSQDSQHRSLGHRDGMDTLISQKPAFKSRCFADSTTWKAIVIPNQLQSSGGDGSGGALTGRRSIGERQEVKGVFLGHGCAMFWNANVLAGQNVRGTSLRLVPRGSPLVGTPTERMNRQPDTSCLYPFVSNTDIAYLL